MIDVSAYLVIGRENCTQPVEEIVRAAAEEGFTCVQIRSKNSSARELIDTLEKSARAIKSSGRLVTLLINDRLDVALAAREVGIKVDGVHVGQSDIPVEVCRKFLGADSIVGLSAKNLSGVNFSAVDYLGVGALHSTATKSDTSTVTLEEISKLVEASPVPIVVGGGVKTSDLPALKLTGAQGFFVVSAVTAADNPRLAARELVTAWKG